jgi:hypothetical protein
MTSAGTVRFTHDVTSAGHAIDYHRVGAAFQTQQLAFALQVSPQRSPTYGPRR